MVSVTQRYIALCNYLGTQYYQVSTTKISRLRHRYLETLVNIGDYPEDPGSVPLKPQLRIALQRQSTAP